MKKVLFLTVLSLFIINIFSIKSYSHDIFYNPYDICTRAYDVYYDKQNKLFIIPADKKKYSVKIVFTKKGKIINFNDKVIQYKNGRFSKIGNDYISYLNGKLYTIGGKKVKFDANNNVIGIGNMTPHQYFIGNSFTQEDAVKSNGRTPGMSYNILADGTDFGGIYSDIIIFFDGEEVVDGSKMNREKELKSKNNQDWLNCSISKIGNQYVSCDASGHIYRIGTQSVSTWANGKIIRIGDKSVSYDLNGRISQIGDENVSYWADGRIIRIGNKEVSYNANGKINRIGNEDVYYK